MRGYLLLEEACLILPPLPGTYEGREQLCPQPSGQEAVTEGMPRPRCLCSVPPVPECLTSGTSDPQAQGWTGPGLYPCRKAGHEHTSPVFSGTTLVA